MPDQSLLVRMTDAWGNVMGSFIIEPETEWRNEEPIDIAEVVRLICKSEYQDEGHIRTLSYNMPADSERL